VLGMPVRLLPLHESIKEFKRAVLKVDSELKVSVLLVAALIHRCNFFYVLRFH
jgi:hypothetical protein